MIIVLLKLDVIGTVIPKAVGRGHPPIGPRTIPGGKTASGTIDLKYDYPDLVAILKRDDVALFWTYQPSLSDGTQFERDGGWLLLNKLPK